jgi:oligopeptide transport system substrate-binding protein
MTDQTKKGLNRRLALGGAGAAAALGVGYLAFGRPKSGGARHGATPAGVLHRGNGAEPASLDPSFAQTETEENILGDLMIGLMTDNPGAQPIPGMALSWTTSDDGLVWAFKLRDAQWSDGAPVTADDFVFSWRRLVDPNTAAPYAYFLYVLKNAEAVNAGKMPLSALGIKALDPKTLELTLEHPAAYLLEMLTHMTLYPEPRHVVEAKGKAWARPGNHVCNGPFLLKEWVPNEYITLEKNSRFFDAANVKLDRIVYYPTDDYDAALNRLRAGELDTQNRVPAQDIGWIRTHMPEILDPITQFSVEYIAVNHRRKPFDDIRVRAALSMAINREAIVDKIRRVGDKPAYGIVPPGIANFPGNNALDFKSLSNSQRLAKAQALMREAGFGPGNRVTTTFMIRSTAAGSYRAVAAALQQMFSQVYVDVTILANDFAIFTNIMNLHDFDIAEAAWGADFNDAETFFNLFRTGGVDNWGQYSNPAFDALLAKEQMDSNLESRGHILAQAEALLLKDHATLPLFFWANPDMTRPYVKGWTSNHMNYHRSRWLSIDQSARAALFT